MVNLNLALAIGAAVAAPSKLCRDLKVEVSLSSDNTILNLDPITTDIDSTDLFLKLGRQNSDYGMSISEGTRKVTTKTTLGATYCAPEKNSNGILQILTHGVGFDRSYWDLPIDGGKYSYVARALEAGYATLAWDRLGIADSYNKNLDPIQDVQIMLEIAALKALTEAAKNGEIKGVKKPSKVVHAGHSFGSAMTYGLTSMYPTISDGIILQGFSTVPGFLNYFLMAGNFVPVNSVHGKNLHRYKKGYLASETQVSVHLNFFGPSNFDPKVLDYAFKNQQAFTPGEIITVGAPLAAASKFSNGPVLIITGERDVPFCGGDCYETKPISDSASDLIASSKPLFPETTFQSKVINGTGHAMNMEKTVPETYKAMIDFLDNSVKNA